MATDTTETMKTTTGATMATGTTTTTATTMTTEAPRDQPPARPTPGVRSAPAAKPRPDPRPSRLALGAGALAAISVMVGGLASVPVADQPVSADPGPSMARLGSAGVFQGRVRYVQLRPGERPPPGARVIDAAQPTPLVVITRVQRSGTGERRTTTRQSGRR